MTPCTSQVIDVFAKYRYCLVFRCWHSATKMSKWRTIDFVQNLWQYDKLTTFSPSFVIAWFSADHIVLRKCQKREIMNIFESSKHEPWDYVWHETLTFRQVLLRTQYYIMTKKPKRFIVKKDLMTCIWVTNFNIFPQMRLRIEVFVY